MKETGLTGKRRSTTIAATPDDENSQRKRRSPVNLWFDLDKIATETLFVGNDSHTHPEQHIKNIEQSK